MKYRYIKIADLSVVFLVVVMIHACAPSGEMTGNSDGAKEYAVEYEQMKKIVEKAIRGSIINLDDRMESKGGDKMTYRVNREDPYSGSQSIQLEQGAVRIIRVDSMKSRVEVDNPDYHFSVPEHERRDYQRILFMRIDKLVNSGS